MSTTKTKRALRAIGYARISNDDAAEGKGVKRQSTDVSAEIKRQGWTAVEAVVIDNDLSASRYSRKRRPGWERILTLAQAGAIDVIVAYNLDRLTRQPRELEDLIDLAESGLRVVTLQGDLNLGTEDGRAMARVLMAMAAKETDASRRRVKRQQEQARAEGRRHNGSRRLFGYTLDMVIIEAEAAPMREAVAKVAAGESANSAARWLDSQGVLTSMGKRWQSGTVRSWIANPAVAGQVGHLGKAMGEGQWQGIITVEEQAAAMASMATRAQPGRAQRGTPTLFAGLLVCDNDGCGSRLVRSVSSTGPKEDRRMYRSWRCRTDRGGCGSNSITGEIEDYLTAQVLDVLPEVRVRRRLEHGRPVLRTEAEVQGDAARLLDAAGLLAADEYERRRTALEAELAQVRAASAAPTSAEALLDGGEDVSAVWGDLHEDVQRSLLHLVLGKVSVRKAVGRHTWSDAVAEKRLSIEWAA